MQRDAVHGRAHGVLADAEVHRAAVRVGAGSGLPSGRKDECPSIVVLFQPARSAEPPHSSGSTAPSASSTSPDALRVATPCPPGRPAAPSPSRPAAARADPVELGGALRVGGAPLAEALLPLGVRLAAAVGDLAGVRQDLVRDREVLVRVEAQHLLGRGDLVRAERRAVRRAGVLLVRGGPGDDGAQRDQRGARRSPPARRAAPCTGPRRPGPRLCLLLDALDVPAVRLVAREGVLGEGGLGVALDRDVVVVLQHDQVAELLVARRGRTPRRRCPPPGRRRRRWPRCGGRTGTRPRAASGSNRPRS